MTEFGLVLAYFRRIGLASMALLPGVSARGVETGALLVQGHICLVVPTALNSEILLEGDEEPRCCPVRIDLALALLSIPAVSLIVGTCCTSLLLPFLFLDLLHFCCKIGFIFVTEEHGEILVSVVSLL